MSSCARVRVPRDIEGIATGRIGVPYIRVLVHSLDGIDVSYGFMGFGNDTSRGIYWGDILPCRLMGTLDIRFHR